MGVAEPPHQSGQKRVSHEAELLKGLQASIADLGVAGVHGQGAANKFGVSGWELPPLQQFQYGDLRVELAATTLIVEAETAGGVTNLVKYWPLLRSGALAKRLVILHVYRVSSNADYIAHRKLWLFLVDRMTADLAANGIGRPERWDAQLITYRKGGSLGEVAALLRKTIMESRDTWAEPTVLHTIAVQVDLPSLTCGHLRCPGRQRRLRPTYVPRLQPGGVGLSGWEASRYG